jgi:hypothetical protein
VSLLLEMTQLNKQNKVDSQIVFVIGEVLRDEIDTNNSSILERIFSFSHVFFSHVKLFDLTVFKLRVIAEQSIFGR